MPHLCMCAFVMCMVFSLMRENPAAAVSWPMILRGTLYLPLSISTQHGLTPLPPPSTGIPVCRLWNYACI